MQSDIQRELLSGSIDLSIVGKEYSGCMLRQDREYQRTFEARYQLLFDSTVGLFTLYLALITFSFLIIVCEHYILLSLTIRLVTSFDDYIVI